MSKARLQEAQMRAETAVRRTNKQINILGQHTYILYQRLNEIQNCFDKIRNVPSEKLLQYDQLRKIRLSWKQQAEKIDSDYKHAAIKSVGGGAAAVGAGVAVAALGPTAAMGIATTFGVASTGTAISALSGAAATNAALAWLGGGALAMGGGGMAAGNAFLALAGPIGWAIAGAALLGSGLLLWKSKSEKERLENIFTLISKRDEKSYALAIVELNERIARIQKEVPLLEEAVNRICSFGIDYTQMTESQQYELGSYVNLMEASTQLLVAPIEGLVPKYTQSDLDEFLSGPNTKEWKFCVQHENLIIALSNFLYRIDLDRKDKKLVAKSLRSNKEFLDSMNLEKKNIHAGTISIVEECLQFKYMQT